MLFNTLKFALFLLVVFGVYRLIERWKWPRILWLLGTSYLFYASWNPWYLILILASTVLDYVVGKGLTKSENHRVRRGLLWTSILGNLGILSVFKYGNFALGNLELAAGALGFDLTFQRVSMTLPVGISFYTFQTLSYTIDLYRRRIEPARNFPEFALFVAFFPQLVAGPIVRASEFLPQLEKRPRLDPAAIGLGLSMILAGLVKKMVIADSIRHQIVDPFFRDPSLYNGLEALGALWSFYFQLYCDFSGYTDVAIGAALLFGFQLPLNFMRPGLARSPLEHWQRWHITLQRWLRDYVYIPLGGSRRGRARTLLNIVIVFSVGGIWHGAGWTYALMGLYNGLLAVAWYTLAPPPAKHRLGRIVEGVLCLQLIVLSMVGMRPYSVSDALVSLSALTRWGSESGGLFNPAGLLFVGAALVLHFSPVRWRDQIRNWFAEAPAFAVAVAVVLVAGLCSLFAENADAFYYFQF
jgi:alginate O-acetyltransferase complex protein AlgI